MPKKTIFIISLIFTAFLATLFFNKTQQANIAYYKGQNLFREGQYLQAIEAIEKSLALNPDNINALELLAFSYQWTGRHNETIETCRKILSLNPKNNKMKKVLAETLSWTGNYAESILFYRELIQSEDDIELYRRLAEVYMWDKQYDKAREVLQDVIKGYPDDFEANLLLAKVMHYAGEAEKSVEIYEKLLEEETVISKKEKKAKRAKEVKTLLGEALMIGADYDEAIRQYREVLEDEPEDLKVIIGLADILGWQKKYDESIAEYKKALVLEPDNLEVQKKLAAVYSWAGNFVEAEELYKKIIEENPRDFEAYRLLGEVLTWDKKYSEAVYYFDIILSQKAEDAKTRLQYAKALLFSGDIERAREVLGKAVEQNPSDLEALMYLADTFAYTQRYERAVSLYEKILQSEDNPEVKRKLADVLSWDRNYERALNLYDEILSAREDKKVRLQKARVLGWARRYKESVDEYQKILEVEYDEKIDIEMKGKQAYWNGRVKTAIKLYKEIVEDEPENAEAWFDLGQIYSYQSMWAGAIEAYQKILEMYSSHNRARAALDKCEIVSVRPVSKAGYEFFEADSSDRVSDVRRHTFSNKISLPLNYKISVDVNYALTGRQFADFSDITENKSGFEAFYNKNPFWNASAFYTFIHYNKGIDSLNVFGGNFNFRLFDFGTSSFSFAREPLENSSEVIRENYYQDNFKERVDVNVNKRLRLGFDYSRAEYSDDNYKNEPAVDLFYYLSFEPRRLSVKYRYFYRDFDRIASEYFSPQDFWSQKVSLEWRHFLNKEEVFFGADDLYYTLGYDAAVDSEDIVNHKFSAGLNWDINKKLNFNIEGFMSNSSSNVYEDKGVKSSVKIFF